jgi:phosphoribosylanthranilate isomerase
MILKICGITNQDDATAAMDAGANAIGFNFYPKSPRYIAPERAAEIATAEGIRRVGVFVNESRERVQAIGRLAALETAQLHGDESPADYPVSLAVWKAMRVGSDFDMSFFDGSTAEALVLDGPAGDLYGGAGRTFDWSVASASTWRIILAGGLDASNVAQAIKLARPWGIDACSRLESAPGKKDHRKMNEFLQAAKAALRS